MPGGEPSALQCTHTMTVAPGTTGAIAEALRTALPYTTILLQGGVYTVRKDESRIAGAAQQRQICSALCAEMGDICARTGAVRSYSCVSDASGLCTFLFMLF